MSTLTERAAFVALLRHGTAPWRDYVEAVEMRGSALEVLEQERGLLAMTELAPAVAQVERWESTGPRFVTVLDEGYPNNLRAVHDRPPFLFLAGRLEAADERAVAVIGARKASRDGLAAAQELTAHLVGHGYTIVSGLALGIDSAAHTTALRLHGRTAGVIGTGLDHAYPPQNAALQADIAARGALVSRFWPDQGPTRESFPMRNAVMSGLALATVIVEASQRSGTRIQARHALAHGRPVFLRSPLLAQEWAGELAERPGVHVYDAPETITRTLERLTAATTLSE